MVLGSRATATPDGQRHLGEAEQAVEPAPGAQERGAAEAAAHAVHDGPQGEQADATAQHDRAAGRIAGAQAQHGEAQDDQRSEEQRPAGAPARRFAGADRSSGHRYLNVGISGLCQTLRPGAYCSRDGGLSSTACSWLVMFPRKPSVTASSPLVTRSSSVPRMVFRSAPR